MNHHYVQVTVLVKINGTADVDEVMTNADYDFTHSDITETEITGWEIMPSWFE
jgi:hypothetical protein